MFHKKSTPEPKKAAPKPHTGQPDCVAVHNALIRTALKEAGIPTRACTRGVSSKINEHSKFNEGAKGK